jgi:excisionase family DNA binding protein
VSADPTRLELSLPPEILEQLAERAAEIVLERLEPLDADRWMDAGDAAAYLGLTRNALHKLTARRGIPFAQDATGGKCWFQKSELDAWRRGGAV